MRIKLLLFCSFMVLLTKPVLSKEYSSTTEATTVIELYTSEGCSSCPPADRWMTQLKTNPGLFKNFIPIAYHVDYWNQLGWKDRFSDQAYSTRQRQHQLAGNISQVYTPGLVVNSKEWRGLLNGERYWPGNQKEVGVLKVDHNPSNDQLDVSFSSISDLRGQQLRINVAILGMDLSTDVKNGENSGSKLQHDFVVLNHNEKNVDITDSKIQKWQIDMPQVPFRGQQNNALVVWLSQPQSLHILQATGGYI